MIRHGMSVGYRYATGVDEHETHILLSDGTRFVKTRCDHRFYRELCMVNDYMVEILCDDCVAVIRSDKREREELWLRVRQRSNCSGRRGAASK